MTTQSVQNKMTYKKNAEGLFVCPECDKTERNQSTMFYHMKKHAGEMRYVCHETGCGKAFIQKCGLQQHRIQTHPAEGVTVWNCPQCTLVCKTKPNLLMHIGRKHGAGWIPKQENGCCVGCKKQFASSAAYYYHAVQCFQSQKPSI